MQSCDLALHFQSRLIQASILNATRLSYDKTVHYLRKIAECWASHKSEAVRALECINSFKKMVENQRPASEIWRLLLSIEPKASTNLQKNFVEMMARNEMLNFCMAPPTGEDSTDRLIGEKPFDFENCFNPSKYCIDPSSDEVAKAFTNEWNEQPLPEKVILLSVMQHQQMIMVPIIWEGSTIKLLGEFAALSNVAFDIPPMESPQMAAEVMRRMQFYMNHKINGREANYTTPYRGFYHHHMPTFNTIVADALAVPNGVTMRAMSQEGAAVAFDKFYLRPSASKQKMVALQWPYRLKMMRIIDTSNIIYGLDMAPLVKTNKGIQEVHVGLDNEGLFCYPESDISSGTVATLMKKQFGGSSDAAADKEFCVTPDRMVRLQLKLEKYGPRASK